MTSSMRRNVDPGELGGDLRPYAEAFADLEYLADEYDRLEKAYPEQWVAIHERNVVAADADHELLMQLLDNAHVDQRSALIFFVTTRPQVSGKFI